MKKIAFAAALTGLVSATAFAAPVGQTFAGFGAGVDLTSTKYEGAKRAAGVGIVADYGFDYGNDLVGLVEGKIKLNDSKLVDKNINGVQTQVKENWRASVSYLQGYRVLPDLLPYAKVGYIATKSKATKKGSNTFASVSETGSGLAYGLGAKYAVSSNFEVGAEYLRSQVKFDGEKVKGDTFGANATYRF